MIQIAFQFNTVAEAAAMLAQLNGQQLAAVVPPTSVSANEKAAVLLATEAALADTVDPPKAEAPGKPSAATTAPSPRTAEAAPSPSAPSPAAPETAPTVTAAPAAASSASAPADFDYATLQKAVNAAVPKHGKDKLLAIARTLGADNFKGLPADKWAAAHADVVALG